jgi:hypothetical protein
VFPTAALPLEALDRILTDLVLRADEVMLDATKASSASLNLTLLDGRLGLNDLVLQAGGGQVAGDAAIEAEAGAAKIMVRLSASDIAVGDLLSDFGATEKVMGKVDIWRREHAIRVNCLIREFDIEDGGAQAGAMLDSQRMTLLGEGTVDLGAETFDLELRPLPKTQKSSTLAIPSTSRARLA